MEGRSITLATVWAIKSAMSCEDFMANPPMPALFCLVYR